MADVTVEFGAKDVGFEKILTQIREENERLKNSLKGTELAMEDIESTMRKIGKNDAMEKRIRSLGGAMDETKVKTEKFANSGSLVKDFATGFAFTEIVSGTKQLMDEFDRIGDLAVRFDTSAETIQKVGVAAKMSGTDIEAVAGAMTKAGIAATNAADNGGEMAEKFKLAGIDAREFANADLDKKLLMIAQAYQDAAGDASKLNAIISIMGSKGGADLIPLISNVDELRATMDGASVATNESVASIQKANDAIDEMTQTLKVWGAEVIGYLVDGVQSTGERVGNILSGGVGKTIKELDADIDRLTAKARLAGKGVKPTSEDKSIKGTGMGAEATTGTDLLNTVLSSIAGPINDIKTGTSNFRDKQNADAAIAKQNIDPNVAADYEKQVVAEIALMKEEAAAKEKATAEQVAKDKQAAIDKVKEAELAAFNEQVANTTSLMTMKSEYNANLEGISATTNETNSFLQEQSSILSENLDLKGSLSASTEDQNEYLGDQAKQLEIVKGLYEDINTEENEAQKKYREKAEEKAKDDKEKAQKKREKDAEDAAQKAQQEYDSSMTGQAYNRIDAAKKEFKVTAGGRISENMNKAISEGRFGAAEQYANQIARRESAYEDKQISRMVKDKGMTRSEAEASVQSKKQQNDPMGTLVKYTEEIKNSVSNIEDALPQKALTA
jgi:hypothetical protein